MAETIDIDHIRDRWADHVAYWSPIWEEGAEDMRFLVEGSWKASDREARAKNGRPSLSFDRLGQYVAQVVNQSKQFRRAVRVSPVSATPQSKAQAELRAGLIRGIEYKSRAVNAYLHAFEDSVSRGYGFWRVKLDAPGHNRMGEEAARREISIERVLNPNTITMDPDAEGFVFEDAGDAFETWIITEDKFRKRYPSAEFSTFGDDVRMSHPAWFGARNRIVLCRYWYVKETTSTKAILKDGREVPESDSEYRNLDSGSVAKRPMEKTRQVCWYEASGLEIVDRGEWPGDWIPLIFVPGKELYVPEGSGLDSSRRVWHSLIRRARDAQHLYNVVMTNLVELSMLMPKAKYVAVAGQFDGFEDQWERAFVSAIAYLQYNAKTTATGEQVLTPPMPVQADTSGIVGLLQVSQQVERTIQAILGMYNSTVGNQDTAARSGRAIERLRDQAERSTFHHPAALEAAIEQCGRVINDLLPKVYTDPREVLVVGEDEKEETMPLNTVVEGGAMVSLDGGEYEVTISTGPSNDSAQESAGEFLGDLMKNQMFAPRIADLTVESQRHNLGPLTDKLKERVTPPEFANKALPPQAQAIIGQLQQQIQAIDAYAKKLEEDAKSGQVQISLQAMKNESAQQIAQLENTTKLLVETLKAENAQAMETMRQNVDEVKLLVELMLTPEPGTVEESPVPVQ